MRRSPRPCMYRQEVFFTCPQCHAAFSLKGPKLKDWVKRKKKKKSVVGPFCNYKCSGKWNAKNASKARKLVKSSKG